MSKYLEKHQDTLSKQSNGFKNNSNENEYDSSQQYNSHRSYVYDLFAVCNHKGQNMANGHYTGNFF